MKVLIAGGGTGGHLFPGIALAEEVTTRHPTTRWSSSAPTRGLEARVVPAAGYPLETIQVRGPQGHGPAAAAARRCSRCPLAFLAVVAHPAPATGRTWWWAWAATPPGRWCSRRGCCGIPTAVQEQNALPGLTNKVLGRFVRVVFIAFEEARALLPRAKVHLIGNPIRRKLMDNYLRSQRGARALHRAGLRRLAGRQGLNARMLEALDSPGGPEGRAPLRPPDRQDRPRDGAQGLRRRRASTPRWWSSSTTCPPPTRGRSWSSAAPARPRWPSSPSARRRRSSIPFPLRHRQPPGGERARRWWTRARR